MRPGAYALKVVDVAGLVVSADRDALPAQYVESFDVDAHGGRGSVTTTADLDSALILSSFREAYAAWTRQSDVRPFREDGQPNRPLTAFTIELVHVDTERAALAAQAGR